MLNVHRGCPAGGDRGAAVHAAGAGGGCMLRRRGGRAGAHRGCCGASWAASGGSSPPPPRPPSCRCPAAAGGAAEGGKARVWLGAASKGPSRTRPRHRSPRASPVPRLQPISCSSRIQPRVTPVCVHQTSESQAPLCLASPPKHQRKRPHAPTRAHAHTRARTHTYTRYE
jgi:hypothetical protein